MTDVAIAKCAEDIASCEAALLPHVHESAFEVFDPVTTLAALTNHIARLLAALSQEMPAEARSELYAEWEKAARTTFHRRIAEVEPAKS